LKGHQIDLGIATIDNDAEDIFERKNEIPPEEYVLTDADYYRGVQTILNSERAALANII
jgi:hypothetical protein